MEPSPPVAALVEARSSWRSYRPEDLPAHLLAQVDEVLARAPPGPFGHTVRLALLPASPSKRAQARKLGTYGVIQGAPWFLAGAVADGPHALEDYGYVFEWVLLQLTGLGLGSCWLGGTFKREDFGRALHATPDELVPAVSPVGWPTHRRSLVDHTFRAAAGSKHRKAWAELFFDGALGRPLSRQQAGAWAPVLELVRLAPSASNKQPWRIVREAGPDPCWHFLLQRTPGYRLPLVPDLQRVDMGIALCHFELGAREAGLGGGYEVAPPTLGQLPSGTSYLCSWVPAA